jgi:hypothetical protein
MRTRSQEIWDRIVLLHLLQDAQQKKGVDNVKIQKLTFISEITGAAQKLKAAHYPFFRFTYGPYSKELANEVTLLEELCFINSESRELTDRAKLILKYVDPEVRQSGPANEVLAIVRRICTAYKGYESFPDLVNAVYDMVVPVAGWDNAESKIKDIPLCVDILRPDDLKASEVMPLPDDLIDDLEAEFLIPAERLDVTNPGMLESVSGMLRRALEN